MGFWSFYFFAKLALHASGHLGLHWLPNVVFALALSVPLVRASWRRARLLAAVPVAVALLWHDSYWPPVSRLVSQWSTLSQFSPAYVGELVERVISWQVVGGLLLGAAAFALVSRYVRLGVFAVLALLAVPLLSMVGWGGGHASPDAPEPQGVVVGASAADATSSSPLAPAELENLLQQFYSDQLAQSVVLPDTRGEPPFDLVVLSVCSLAWDDLKFAGLDESLLLRRFDLVFRQFNSAASYSGPAVLRLLHAGCGQGPQHMLYEPSGERCYLFRRLNTAGWRSSLLLNHDGHFDGFAEQLRLQGGMGLQPASNRNAPVAMHSFDGSPVYGDFELLTRWWQGQVGAKAAGVGGARAPKFALLYNTISLHDGNRVPGLASTNSLQTWKPRAQRLFSDFERFFSLVEQSGRPTVVLLVPEHGAGLRGDALQIQGLREYPTPRITHVPAGVALLGFGRRPANTKPAQVQQLASYSSMLALVGSLMQADGRSPWTKLAQTGAALPTVPWVAETDKTVIMKRGPRTYVRESADNWSEYPLDR